MLSFEEWINEQSTTKVDIKVTTIKSAKDDHPIDDSNSAFDRKKLNAFKKSLSKSINRNLNSYTEWIEDSLQECLNPKYFSFKTISSEHDFRYQGTINYNYNQYLLFKAHIDDAILYSDITVWVCHDFHDDPLFDALKDEYPEGTILTCQWGYGMVLYDFYRIVKYDKKSVILEKLIKDSKLSNINKQGGYYTVVPTKKSESSKKYKILDIERSPHVKIDEDRWIYFKDEYRYDPKKNYLEDHND